VLAPQNRSGKHNRMRARQIAELQKTCTPWTVTRLLTATLMFMHIPAVSTPIAAR
jgi:hypothetical protein